MVRPLAERLRVDGLKVWFDEWVLKPGDSIPAKIEAGLERSRVLVLCMSANAFGSDWAQLEAGTFRFRDPLNKERRFIPLRLDDAPMKGSLAQFLYIDWRPEDREQGHAQLLDIDMEIEFSDDAHEATGAKLYLQLKSGDSYLRERKSDAAEIFTIKDERHARYWMVQAFPVLLVIRNSEGEVCWMAVRDWLKHESDNGEKPVKQITFEGERFDVMSVRRWRERVLGGGSGRTG